MARVEGHSGTVTTPPGGRRGGPPPGMTAGQKRYVPALLSIRVQTTLEMGAPGIDLDRQLGASRDHGNQQPHVLRASEITVYSSRRRWASPAVSLNLRRREVRNGGLWEQLSITAAGAAQPRLPPGVQVRVKPGSQRQSARVPSCRSVAGGKGRPLHGGLAALPCTACLVTAE